MINNIKNNINNINNIMTTCKICNINTSIDSPRYPNTVCVECNNSSNIMDSDGNNVYFINESFDGGFISVHTIDNNVVYKKEHTCYINGIKCYADEARFGGIVIQTI